MFFPDGDEEGVVNDPGFYPTEFEYMEDSLITNGLVGTRFSKSVNLPSKGSGSLYIEGRVSGLVTISHRFFEGEDVHQRKLGYHAVCYSSFIDKYPNASFLSIADAVKEAKLVFEESEVHGSILEVYLIREFKQQSRKKNRLSFRDLLEGYIKAKYNQSCYKDCKSSFTRNIFNRNDMQSVLAKQANKIVYEDVEPVIRSMMHRNIKSSVDLLMKYLSASYTWAARFEKDHSNAKALAHGIFDVDGFNPFKTKPVYNKNPDNKKYQFTDRQLWLLWHGASAVLGTFGPLVQFLIASGGIRPGHAVKLRWDTFNRKSLYPHLVAVNAKTGMESAPYQYSVGLNPLGLHIIESQYERTYRSPFVFPSRFDFNKPKGQNLAKKSQESLYRWCRDRYNYRMPVTTMGMIRGSCTTRLSLAGVHPEMNDMIQAHNLELSSVRHTHYDNAKHLQKKAAALLLWDEYLRDILTRPYEDVLDVLPEDEEMKEGEVPVIQARGL